MGDYEASERILIRVFLIVGYYHGVILFIGLEVHEIYNGEAVGLQELDLPII